MSILLARRNTRGLLILLLSTFRRPLKVWQRLAFHRPMFHRPDGLANLLSCHDCSLSAIFGRRRGERPALQYCIDSVAYLLDQNTVVYVCHT